MQTLKKPLSIKIIYWITNITFWIYSAVTVFAIGLAFSFIFKFLNETQLHVGIPVGVDILEKGTLDLDLHSTYIDVEFKEMYGKIHFINTPAALGQIYGFFMLVMISLFYYIFLTFRKFINNVYKGYYFDIDNISLLKNISYTMVVVWFFTVFYAYFQYFYLVKNLQFNTVEIGSDVNSYPTILLAALLIWVLSHIFMKGCKLEEENNYTI